MGKSSSADNSIATRLVQTSPMSHPELPHITPFRSEQGIAESMIRHTILPPRNGFDEHTRLNTARRHGALPAVGYRGPVLQRPSTIFQLQWTTDQVEDGDEDNGGYGKLHLQRSWRAVKEEAVRSTRTAMAMVAMGEESDCRDMPKTAQIVDEFGAGLRLCCV